MGRNTSQLPTSLSEQIELTTYGLSLDFNSQGFYCIIIYRTVNVSRETFREEGKKNEF